MGYRLTKIYTRTGDDGTTGLGDGSRIAKRALRVHVIGEIDELNCALGLVLACAGAVSWVVRLEEVQRRLFDIGGELAVPGLHLIDADRVVALESWLDAINETLPPLTDFVLPGGGPAAAHCHLARAICRRSERGLWELAASEEVNLHSLTFINRLSDLLFVLARALARDNAHAEPLWHDSESWFMTP
ncbi:MAG: cob(I)yrinic acid a,c-diamide adenosyltransferase [Gammaproteobacteria bacterium]|nr:cob(I)yrinic acid a,c-diamide adenosyltransferase [Gammaproteobacteria bacterium]